MMNESKQLNYKAEAYVVLSEEGYNMFMKATEEFDFGILFKLTLLYGFRQGELINQFKRSKVNYEKETIEIAGKTGTRILPFFPGTKELLIKLEEQIAHNIVKNKGNYCHAFNDHLCVDACGDLIKPEQLSLWLKQICEKAELLNIHFHTLRRTAISWVANQGWPRDKVFAFAGHKPI